MTQPHDWIYTSSRDTTRGGVLSTSVRPSSLEFDRQLAHSTILRTRPQMSGQLAVILAVSLVVNRLLRPFRSGGLNALSAAGHHHLPRLLPNAVPFIRFANGSFPRAAPRLWRTKLPLVQIDLPRSVFEEKGSQISKEVHQAFIDSLDIPANDKFQIFRPRELGELVFDNYPGVDRKALIVLQILMVHHYTVELKREMFRSIVARLAALGIRPEDIFISVAENAYEDWYAGRLYGE